MQEFIGRFFQALWTLVTLHIQDAIFAVVIAMVIYRFMGYMGFGAHRSLRLTRRLEDGYHDIQIPPTYSNQPHQFYHQLVGLFNRPVFCTVCSKIILSRALSCGVCLCSVHENCLSSHNSTCKVVFMDLNKVSKEEYSLWQSEHSINTDIDTPASRQKLIRRRKQNSSNNNNSNNSNNNNNHNNEEVEYAFHHQWLQGNLSTVHDFCIICNETVGSLFNLSNAFNCVWCQRKIHIDCMSHLDTQICDCGEFSRLVVPPTCVHPNDDDDDDHDDNNNDNNDNDKKMKNTKKSKSNKSINKETPGGKRRFRFIPKRVKALYSVAKQTITFHKKEQHHNNASWIVSIPNEIYSDISPLLVFVNPKAGGQWGPHLLRTFKSLLNPLQVFDLSCKGGITAGLNIFRSVPRCRILACGGDGTIAWVLSGIDEVFDNDNNNHNKYNLRSSTSSNSLIDEKQQQQDYDGQQRQDSYRPPVAILPLGTGNDLSRSLDWGGGYGREDDTREILRRVAQSHVTMLDRWDISVIKKNKINRRHVMNCYLGIGMDAVIAKKFHNLREKNPDLFQSQLQNKTRYAQLGAEAYFFPEDNLLDGVCIYLDDNKLDLSGLEGVLLLNIPCYGGGSDLWGSSSPLPVLGDKIADAVSDLQNKIKEKDVIPSMQDSILEVVGIRSSLHMGVIQIGLARSVRLGQGKHIKIKFKSPTDIQIDGEPIHIHHHGQLDIQFRNQAFMLRSSSSYVHHTLTEVADVLDWAETNNVIDPHQKLKLLQAFAQRSEKLSNTV